MDIQTKDGILLRGIPDGTPEEAIKARIAEIRGRKIAPTGLTPPPISARQAEDESMAALETMPPREPLQDKVKAQLGLKDYRQRGTILPIGENDDKSLELAWPQVAVDMATSFALPQHAASGGQYTLKDVTKFALDYAVPATMKDFARGKPLTKSEIIENAPSTDDLAFRGGAKFDAAKNSGVRLNQDKYLDFMVDLEKGLAKEGIDPMLHPKAAAVVKAMTKRVGDEVDIGDLQTVRRQIGIASNSVAPELADERRLAAIMRDSLDSMIDDVTDADLVSGKSEGVADGLKTARALWSRSKKSEIIDGLIEKAQTQASGNENGLRIGLRSLLNNKKAIRGFSDDEISAIKEVVNGTVSTKAMRLLGKMSFGTKGGSNFLGGAIGVGAGSSAFGPLGGVTAPAIGYAAQKAADYTTQRGADYIRALAATGGVAPQARSQIIEALSRSAPATVGAMDELPADQRAKIIDALMQLKKSGGQ